MSAPKHSLPPFEDRLPPESLPPRRANSPAIRLREKSWFVLLPIAIVLGFFMPWPFGGVQIATGAFLLGVKCVLHFPPRRP